MTSDTVGALIANLQQWITAETRTYAVMDAWRLTIAPAG